MFGRIRRSSLGQRRAFTIFIRLSTAIANVIADTPHNPDDDDDRNAVWHALVLALFVYFVGSLLLSIFRVAVDFFGAQGPTIIAVVTTIYTTLTLLQVREARLARRLQERLAAEQRASSTTNGASLQQIAAALEVLAHLPTDLSPPPSGSDIPPTPPTP